MSSDSGLYIMICGLIATALLIVIEVSRYT